MTVAEMIAELQKQPPDLQIIGWHNSQFSNKVFLYEQGIKVYDDSYMSYFDKGDYPNEKPTFCLMIDFE